MTSWWITAGVGADEARILTTLKDFFHSENAAQRRARVERIRSDPEYDRARISEWLDRLDLWPELKPGRESFQLPVGFGHVRTLTLRVPRGYTPDRPWPLIYALHPSGGVGSTALSQAERALGKKVEEFVLVAPTHYRQTVIDAPPPFTNEHLVMLREIRRRVHVDSDRIYVMGYSLGGYAAWTMAMVHADQFAGSVPMASAFSAPDDVDGLWEAFIHNSAQVPILHVWGERDTLGVPGVPGFGPQHHTGTMAELNRKLSPLLEAWGLENVIDHPVPNAGHGGANPPRDDLLEVLSQRRAHYPRKVHHRFRHVHHALAYWLEGHEWEGGHWGESTALERRRGESRSEALGRLILPRLGLLAGEIDGQTLRITESRHLSELTVWLGDGMIDWEKPVRVELGGRLVYAGELRPDLGVCLSQAARTLDFDRLRWAGLRIEGSRARPVTAATEFPPLIRVE